MRLYITGLSEKDIQNIAATMRCRKPPATERGQTMVQDLVENAIAATRPRPGSAMVVPKIAGQDRDYLVMAIRAYRDDRRNQQHDAHHEPALRRHGHPEHRLVLRRPAGEMKPPARRRPGTTA